MVQGIYGTALLCEAASNLKLFSEFKIPKYLRAPLNHGVIVIIAHCAMPYFAVFDKDYNEDFAEFIKLFEEADKKNSNLYADLSAICTPFRKKYVEFMLEKVKTIPSSRLICGSDYPVPLSELRYNRSKNFFSWLKNNFKVATMENPLDKNFELA